MLHKLEKEQGQKRECAVTRQIFRSRFKIISNAVYGEARGEPYEGQVAVAAVILNRVEHPDFPDTVGGVIFQPGAFTAVDDGQIWLEPNNVLQKLFLMQSMDGILLKMQFTILIRLRQRVNGFGHDRKLRKSVCIFFVTDLD